MSYCYLANSQFPQSGSELADFVNKKFAYQSLFKWSYSLLGSHSWITLKLWVG